MRYDLGWFDTICSEYGTKGNEDEMVKDDIAHSLNLFSAIDSLMQKQSLQNQHRKNFLYSDTQTLGQDLQQEPVV